MCIDSRCQSFTAQWCISPSLREALLDARRDTVTHRATTMCETDYGGGGGNVPKIDYVIYM